MELGKLSEKYEVGKRGAATIGWDSRGKASYGRYQIASGTGTMKRFLEWCFAQSYSGPREIYSRLWPLLASATSKSGGFAREWQTVWAEAPNTLAAAEHTFIQETHYERAKMDIWGGAFQALVVWQALQQVLWSTAVQHGPASAVKIFHSAWSKGFDFEDPTNVAAYISCIYLKRSQRLSKLTDQERRAVLRRYRLEERDAHSLIEHEAGAAEGSGAPTE